jgi:hypothetical protein
LDLTIADPSNTTWLPGTGGLRIDSDTIINSTDSTAADALRDALISSNEITIDALVMPESADQSGPARIVTFSQDTSERFFALGHSGTRAIGRLRTTDGAVSNNGTPALETPDNTMTTSPMRIVYTREASGAERIYVDGVEVASGTRGGDFSNWTESYTLALANELTNNRDWLGTYYRIAIYDQAVNW